MGPGVRSIAQEFVFVLDVFKDRTLSWISSSADCPEVTLTKHDQKYNGTEFVRTATGATGEKGA